MAVGGQDGDGHGVLHRLGQVHEPTAGHLAGELRDDGLVPPAGDVQQVYPHLFQLLAEGHAVLVGAASLHEVVAGHTHHHRVIRPHGVPHRLHQLHAEATAVFKAAAVLVRPQVGHRGEELADEIAGTGGDLHAVHPGLFAPEGGGGVALLHQLDVLQGHGARGGTGHPGEDVGGGEKVVVPLYKFLPAIAAGGEELDAELAVIGVNRVRQIPPAGDEPVVVHPEHMGVADVGVGCRAAGDNHAHAALGTGQVEVLRPLVHAAVLGVEQVHGGHGQAVFHGHLVDLEGLEQTL